jgi:hypothetical protein
MTYYSIHIYKENVYNLAFEALVERYIEMEMLCSGIFVGIFAIYVVGQFLSGFFNVPSLGRLVSGIAMWVIFAFVAGILIAIKVPVMLAIILAIFVSAFFVGVLKSA